MNWHRRYLGALQGFLFAPETDQWLSILRLGLGATVVLYSVSLRQDWSVLFGATDDTFVGRNFSEAFLSVQNSLLPRVSWLVDAGAQLRLTEPAVLLAVWWACLCAGLALAAGIFSRAAAALAWFIHLCLAQSGALVAYGVDSFLTIGLFYLMLSPLPDRLALDHRWRRPAQDRHLLGFFRRVLQTHLCFIYFFGGLTKALGNGWWNGTNLWRALIRPPFDLIPAELLVRCKYFFPMAGVAVWMLELGYTFAMWRPRLRRWWLVGIITMHAGIGATMGMYLFALVMIVLNLAAFGPGVLWRASAAVTDCRS